MTLCCHGLTVGLPAMQAGALSAHEQLRHHAGGDATGKRAVQDRILAKILDDLIFSSRPEASARTKTVLFGLAESTGACALVPSY